MLDWRAEIVRANQMTAESRMPRSQDEPIVRKMLHRRHAPEVAPPTDVIDWSNAGTQRAPTSPETRRRRDPRRPIVGRSREWTTVNEAKHHSRSRKFTNVKSDLDYLRCDSLCNRRAEALADCDTRCTRLRLPPRRPPLSGSIRNRCSLGSWREWSTRRRRR